MAVPVSIVNTHKELNADVGFFAKNENMYANGNAAKTNKKTRRTKATVQGGGIFKLVNI